MSSTEGIFEPDMVIVFRRFAKWWRVKLDKVSSKKSAAYRQALHFNLLQIAIREADILALIPTKSRLNSKHIDALYISTQISTANDGRMAEPEIVSKRFSRWWKIRLFRGGPKVRHDFRRAVQFNELQIAIREADILALVPANCKLSEFLD